MDLNERRKQIPIRTRIEVCNQMAFISLLSDLGYRKDEMWKEEEEPILNKLCELAKIHTDRILREVKNWEENGRP